MAQTPFCDGFLSKLVNAPSMNFQFAFGPSDLPKRIGFGLSVTRLRAFGMVTFRRFIVYTVYLALASGLCRSSENLFLAASNKSHQKPRR